MRVVPLLATLIAAGTLAGSAAEFAVDGIKYSVDDYTHATVTGLADADLDRIFIPYIVNHSDNGVEHMFFVTRIAADAFAGTGIRAVVFSPPPYSGAASQGALVIEDGAFNTPSLMVVNTFRPHLPEVDGDPFNTATYAEGTLGFGINLTEDQIDEYKSTEPWSRFNKTQVTAVTAPETDNYAGPVEIFTTSGIKVFSGDPQAAALPKGIYIIRRGPTASVSAL